MITLNTIIYEGNFNEFLKSDNWFFTFKSKYITKKLITVNNLTSIDKFNEKINELKLDYDFDIVFVSDQTDTVKKHFNLNLNSSDIGYYYTIPYFVSIYNTTTKYFLNVASDCMSDIKISDDFFNDSLNELDNNQLCLSTMVGWYKGSDEVGSHEESETFRILNKSLHTTKNFYIRFNFTDQFFLSITEKLKNLDYNVSETISSNYYHGPYYGGNCFEKRIVGYHIKYENYNLIYKKHDNHYTHEK